MPEIGIAKDQKSLQRVAVVGLGWMLIIVGIAGLFLPLVPGIPLMVAGALMLNLQWPWLRRAVEKCRMRFPALSRAFERFSARGKGSQSRFSKSPGNIESQFRV